MFPDYGILPGRRVEALQNNDDNGEGGSSVLKGDVTEEVAHALVVVDATDGLSQEDADVHCLDLVTLHLLDLMGYRVGHNHLMTGKGSGRVSEQTTFIRDKHTCGILNFMIRGMLTSCQPLAV